MSGTQQQMRRPSRLSALPLFVLVLAALSAPNGGFSAQEREHRIRDIVLVHGTWADGSGWKGVYDILVKGGLHVSVVQEPETSFKDDVAATKRVLAHQDGKCILVGHSVGHSYEGAVITEARTDPSVAGLVYIAAHMPDAGENKVDVPGASHAVYVSHLKEQRGCSADRRSCIERPVSHQVGSLGVDQV